MKKILLRLLLPAILAGIPILGAMAQGYNWSQVRIGGGGRVTSIKPHPKVPNLFFITTDVGTSYKWNHTTQRWEDLLLGSKIPTNYWNWANSQVSADLAFDPNDATGNTLYVSVCNGAGAGPGGGLDTKGTVMKSVDRGASWTDCGLAVDIKPNSDQIFTDRLVVDPQNSNVIWLTTRSNGTWRSDAAGVAGSWTKLTTAFDTTVGRFIKFDISAGTVNGVTKNMFVGTSSGMYRSTDGGVTFTPMAGGPTGIRRASISKTGIMFVTTTPSATNNGVWKWNGSAWSTVSPDNNRNFKYVAVNPDNSNEVIAASAGTWNNDLLYRSTTGGNANSWSVMSITRNNAEAPHSLGGNAGNAGHDIDMICFDPFNAGHAWFSDMTDVAQTTDVWASTVNWKLRDAGLEEVVVTGQMVAPPSGRNMLLSTTGDVGGFDHPSITDPPPTGMASYFATSTGINTSGVDMQYSDPNFIARVGSDGWNGIPKGGYSVNGGLSYSSFPTFPSSNARGRVAVSATSRTIVWVPMGGATYMTNNLGASWVASSGVPANVLKSGDIYQIYPGQIPLAADRVSGNIFYIYAKGIMYVSQDTGRTFTARASNLPNDGGSASYAHVIATPGKSGDVWFCHSAGMYHSTDTGRTFTQINPSQIVSPKWMAVGRADTSAGSPVVLYVTSNNVPINGLPYAIHRSDDLGATWTTISTNAPGIVMNMTADQYGRVFMGIAGNGIFVGEPVGGPVTAVNLTPPADTLVETDSVQLKATLSPLYPNNRNISWVSTNPSVASVSATGLVKALSAGIAEIIVTTQDGNLKDTTSITVTPFVHVTAISLDTAFYVGLGGSGNIVPRILPADATNKKVTWSSSDTSIVKVNAGGIVNAVALGNATVTATSVDGGITGSIPVRVGTTANAINIGDTVQIENFRKDPNSWAWTWSTRTNNTINLSGVTNPAPQAVYKSARNGLDMGTSYSLGGLVPGGRYMVRLHFVELSTTITTGGRRFNAFVNADTVLKLFDIYAAAGGRERAVIREFPATAGTSGVITVRLQPFTNSTCISAIEAVMRPVDSVSLPNSTAFVGVNDTLRLAPVVSPAEATNKSVTWTSSNTNVATVSSTGLVTGTGVGTAVITVMTNESGKRDSILITADNILVDSVKLAQATDTVGVSNQRQLTATIYPINASDKRLLWTSADTSIVKVSASGLLSGIAPGTATVTVTTLEGGKTASTSVLSVVIPVSSVTLSRASYTLGANDTTTITYTALPANASSRAVNWSSSNTAVATVSTTGFITALTPGAATITAVAQDGGGAGASLALTVVSAGSCGLFENGGFESGYYNWRKVQANGSIITEEAADVHTGLRALKIIGDGAAHNYVGSTPVSGNVPVTLSFWTKVAGSPNPANPAQFLQPYWAGVGIDYYDSAGVKLASQQAQIYPNTPSPTAYTRFAINNVTPAGTVSVGIWISKAGPGYVFADDFCLTINAAAVTIDADSVTLIPGGTRQLSATLLPASASNKRISWTSTDTSVAHVDTTGVVTGNGQGTALVIAASADGSKADTALVTVYQQLITVNSGDVAAAGFAADHSYTGGSATAAVSVGAINTTGVAYAAPATVYTKRRYGNFSYDFIGFAPNTAYTVRLHMIESYWTQAGKRIFNVKINNATVASNIDLYAIAGLNKAVVRDVTGVSDSTGKLHIDFVTVLDHAAVSAIEVLGSNTVYEQVTGINSADAAYGAFAADHSYAGGTAAAATPLGYINASGTVNAAPPEVYSKRRYGSNFSYTIDGLANNAGYVVRLHLIEGYWTQAGQRIFNVKVNQAAAISNLDLFAAAGNKRYKAVVKDIPVTADSTGKLFIQFTAVQDYAAVAGLEVLQLPGSNENLHTEGLGVVRIYTAPVLPSSLKVSPNPVTGNIRFTIGGLSSDNEQLQVIVTSLQGREMYRTRITSGKANAQHELPTGGKLPRGIYLLHISGKNFSQTAKVVVL